MSRMSSWTWKAEPDAIAEYAQGLQRCGREVRPAMGRHHHAGPDQRPGLERVQPLQVGQRERAPFRRQVQCLTPGHAGGAARDRQRVHDLHADGRVGW